MADDLKPDTAPPSVKRRGRPTNAEIAARKKAQAEAAAKNAPKGDAKAAVLGAIASDHSAVAALKAFGLGPDDKDKYVATMWRWIHDYEEACEPRYVRDRKGNIQKDEFGEPIRDFKLELRLQEIKMVMAQKAAQLLRVAFINEKVEIERPAELPLQGLPNYIKNWFEGMGGGEKTVAQIPEEGFDA